MDQHGLIHQLKLQGLNLHHGPRQAANDLRCGTPVIERAESMGRNGRTSTFNKGNTDLGILNFDSYHMQINIWVMKVFPGFDETSWQRFTVWKIEFGDPVLFYVQEVFRFHGVSVLDMPCLPIRFVPCSLVCRILWRSQHWTYCKQKPIGSHRHCDSSSDFWNHLWRNSKKNDVGLAAEANLQQYRS